ADQPVVSLVDRGDCWRDEGARVRGMKERRLQPLLRHDGSLFAYDVTLDAHPQRGNNAGLAGVLGLEVEGAMEPGNPLSIGLTGRLPHAMSAEEFADYVERSEERRVGKECRSRWGASDAKKQKRTMDKRARIWRGRL